MAQRLRVVQFVGIAVPGDEVEKQEVLAQIFVMLDVRKEQSKSIGRMFDNVVIDGMPIIHNGIPVVMSRENQSRSLLDEQKEWAMRDRSSPGSEAFKLVDIRYESLLCSN